MPIFEDVPGAATFDARLPFDVQSITTRQLTLRPFHPADIDALYAIMRDADAMRYTYVAPSYAACAARLYAYAEQGVTLGYAPWTARLRGEERIVGWGGLNIDPYDPDWGPEVAYCFAPAVWGRGLATELVCAALEVGFGAQGLAAISAFAHPDNVGSRRVLEKCGFRRLGYVSQLARDHFVVTGAAWRAARGEQQHQARLASSGDAAPPPHSAADRSW